MREDIEKLLTQLHFKGMAESLERILAAADAEALPATEVLYRLLLEEWRYRQERSLAYRLEQAKLAWEWSLETFPFARQPGVNAAQIKGLAGLDFIARAENLVFIGAPGTGKSGLAIGLLRQALINGYRARFYKAQDLFDELYASLADRSTSRLLNRLSRYDVLQIDELGYLTLKPEQVNAFFKLMDLRYGRRPSIITTNRKCGAPHLRFNAANIVMRTLVPESPEFPLVRTFFSPHKGTGCQRSNQLVSRAEAPRPQLWCGDRFERLQLDGRISANVHLGCLHVGVTEP
jgi:DNA replication protein DnaC